MNKIKLLLRKKLVLVTLGVMVTGGSYGAYQLTHKASNDAKYVMAAAVKGSVITSVSGSGQVSSSNQVDVKAKASGDVYSVAVKKGDQVKEGQILIQLSASDILSSIRDAKTSLETAKLSLTKIQQPPDALSVMQAENSLKSANDSKQQAEDALQKAQEDLKKAYDDGFNSVSNAFLGLPEVMTGLEEIINGNTLNNSGQSNLNYLESLTGGIDTSAWVYAGSADLSYKTARLNYDQNFKDYKALSRFSDTDKIENMINQTYDTTKQISEAIKDTNNLLQFSKDTLTSHDRDVNPKIDTYLSDLNGYTSTANQSLSSLLSAKQAIKNDKDSIDSQGRTIIQSERSITEKQVSLDKLKAGSDALDIRSSALSVQQRQNALYDLQNKLSDYAAKAPFDGIVAAFDLKRGDSISSGTTIATILTKQQIAQISLNEVDVTKVQAGQKATLSFDAVEGLSISGEVIDIDALGTVSQGVVTYNVKIGFDTQDDRIKPGMSVSAAIITEAKQDVLTVSNSAIKYQGNLTYVEMIDNAPQEATLSQGFSTPDLPRQQTVEIGSLNDTVTEILSGLKEGELVVIKTILPTATANTQAPSLFGTGSANRGGGAGAGAGALRGGR